MIKISVVIPAYNCEKTIEKALDSICTQRISSINDILEIIVVDDGSTDHTKEVVIDYCNNHSLVKFFSQNNGGPSLARNRGVEEASGEYIMFVDSDDEVAENAVSVFIDNINTYHSDVIIAGLKRRTIEENGDIKETCKIRQFLNLQGNLIIWENLFSLFQNNILNAPWGRIFRRDLIVKNGIKMDSDLEMGEDLQFNLSYLECANSLTIIPDIVYIYNNYNSYLTKKYRENLYYDRVKSVDLLHQHLDKHDLDCNIVYYLYLKMLIAQSIQDCEYKIKRKKYQQTIRKILHEAKIKEAVTYYKPEHFSDMVLFRIVKSNSVIIIRFFSKSCILLKKICSNKIKRVSV